MNKKSLILFPVVLSILLCATGCSKTEKINYDIDSEINKIISPDLYPKDLLNKDVQDELKQNATNKDIAFVDPTLIGYESAKNQIPTEELFLYTKQNQDATTFDWLGEKWSMTRFEYKLDISAVRIRVGFNNDEIFLQNIFAFRQNGIDENNQVNGEFVLYNYWSCSYSFIYWNY